MKTDQYWTEDFLLVDGHVFGDVVDDGWGDEVALRELRMNVFGSIENDPSTFLLSSSNKMDDFSLEFLVADGTEIDSLVLSSSDLEAFCLRYKIMDPLLGLSNEDNSRQSHTSLSRGSERSID